MESPGTPTEMGKSDLGWKQMIAAAIGVAVVVVFVGSNIYLLSRTRSTDLEWARAVYLLNGVESIAFAAAGYFFGTDVHRRRAEQVEKEVKSAREDAALAALRAAQSETRLHDLRKAILSYSDQLAYGRSGMGTAPAEMLVALVSEIPAEAEASEP